MRLLVFVLLLCPCVAFSQRQDGAFNIYNASTGKLETRHDLYARKDYVDNLALGLRWQEGVENINLIADTASAPAAPALYDSYIIKTGGNSGVWSTFSSGDLVQFQVSGWVRIKSLQIGDRVGIAFLSGTTPAGTMTGKKDNVLTVSGGTAGAYTYTFVAPQANDALLVSNQNSVFYNLVYTYSDVLLKWVQISGAINYTFSPEFLKTGNTISLSTGAIVPSKLNVAEFLAWDKNAADDFNGAYGSLTGVPSTFAPSAHTHAQGDVTGLTVALSAKEPTTAAGTTGQYWRGDKTFQALDKAAVGLNNADNTSDANKPISTATQAALDAKQTTLTGSEPVFLAWDKNAADDFNGAYGSLTGVPSTFAPSAHTHAQGDVTGLTVALSAKEPTIAAGTTGQYWRGDKTFQALDKAAVGLNNVDNTNDANKPISTATQAALDAKQTTLTGSEPVFLAWDKNAADDFNGAYGSLTGVPSTFAPSAHTHDQVDVTGLTAALSAKEPTIAVGTTGQYWRGDKTFQALDKAAVGLNNVDNTSDANKPISTATQTALNAKYNTPVGSTAQYVRGDGSLATYTGGDASPTNEGALTVGNTLSGGKLYSNISSNTQGSNSITVYGEYGIKTQSSVGINFSIRLEGADKPSNNNKYPRISGDTLVWTNLPSLSIIGTNLSISDGNSVSFTGWDTNAADDVRVNDSFNGDVSGSFNSGLYLTQQGAANGQVLKWNSTNENWEAANDLSGAVSDGDKGDVTVSASGASWSVDAGLPAVRIGNGDVDNAELSFLNGATSGIQAQINNKFPNITGANAQMLRHNGAAWEAFTPEIRTTTASNQAISVTTATNITDMSALLTSGKHYEIECRIRYAAAATTTGIALTYTAPAGSVEHEYTVNSASTTILGRTGFNLTTLFVSTASRSTDADNLAIAKFIVDPSASGTFQMQAATEVAGNAITIQSGSRIIVREIL